MQGISDRALQFGKYNRYKYNGIEHDTTFGVDDYETPLRNLDPQTGRWWQIDPQSSDHADDMERWSPYVSNKDNPILYKDPKGDCPACWGALIGATVDYSAQVVKNLSNGQGLSDAMTNIDGKELLVATLAGAASGGISSFYESAAVTGTKVLITEGAAQTVNVAAASVTTQASTGDGSVSASRVVFDMATDKVASGLTESLVPKTDVTGLERQVDRTGRIAANDPTSSGRAANAQQAKDNLSAAKDANFAKQSTTGTSMFGAAGAAADESKAKPSLLQVKAPDSSHSQDATNVRIVTPIIR